jgi:hypothetical protein
MMQSLRKRRTGAHRLCAGASLAGIASHAVVQPDLRQSAPIAVEPAPRGRFSAMPAT